MGRLDKGEAVEGVEERAGEVVVEGGPLHVASHGLDLLLREGEGGGN